MEVVGEKRPRLVDECRIDGRPIRKAAKRSRERIRDALFDTRSRIAMHVKEISDAVLSIEGGRAYTARDIDRRIRTLAYHGIALNTLFDDILDTSIGRSAFYVAVSVSRYLGSQKIVAALTNRVVRDDDTWTIPHHFTDIARLYLSGSIGPLHKREDGGSSAVYDVVKAPGVVLKWLQDSPGADHFAHMSQDRERSLSAVLSGPFPKCVYADFWADPGILYFEEVTGVDMLTRVRDETTPYTFEELLIDLKGWLQCLITLHDRNLVHNDLKLDNLMRGKIIDLGCVQPVGEVEDMGCIHVTPPESYEKRTSLTESNRAETAQDMWKLGAAIFRIFDPEHRVIYQATEASRTQHAIDEAVNQMESSTKNKELSRLLQLLLKVDPKERITARALYAKLYTEED